MIQTLKKTKTSMVRNKSKSEAKETKMRHKSVNGYRKVKICDI